MNQRDLAEYRMRIDARIRADIAGPHRVHIYGTVTGSGISLMHTVGMLEAVRPEIVILGMPYEAAVVDLVNALARWCRQHPVLRAGQDFEIDQYPGIGWRAGLVSHQFCDEYMNKMRRLYADLWRPADPAKVLQILWPDEHGRLPDATFAPAHQPLLATWNHELLGTPLN